MTPDEAHRHEWFAGAATNIPPTTPSTAPAPAPTVTVEEASAAQKSSEESEGVFSASSTSSTMSNSQPQQTSNGTDRSIMYQIFKSKKSGQQPAHQKQPDEASQRDDGANSSPTTGASRGSKRIDGNSNLDDSGTYLPSIL